MEKPNTVKIERQGNVVTIEVTTEGGPEATRLYDEFVAGAHAKGEVTLTMVMLDAKGKPRLTAVPN
jgi:hypothetical protein